MKQDNSQINTKKITVTEEDLVLKRLDHYLTVVLKAYTRTSIKAFIEANKVEVNSELCYRAGYKVKYGDTILLKDIYLLQQRNQKAVSTLFQKNESPNSNISPNNKDANDLEIILEDNDYIFVNKSAGLLVHPNSETDNDTLIHRVLKHISKKDLLELQRIDSQRPGIVHRLDKNTSGIIAVAKNSNALWWLSKQFNERKVIKSYYSIGVTKDNQFNKPINSSFIIESFIIRNTKKNKTFISIPISRHINQKEGKYAKTKFKVIDKLIYNEFSLYLFRIRIYTGRTHQIRLHQKSFFCHVLNDNLYSNFDTNNLINQSQDLFLHSARLKFTNYDGKIYNVKSKIPKRFNVFFKEKENPK